MSRAVLAFALRVVRAIQETLFSILEKLTAVFAQISRCNAMMILAIYLYEFGHSFEVFFNLLRGLFASLRRCVHERLLITFGNNVKPVNCRSVR